MIATCFALTGFASSLLVGAAAGNPATTVIYRSLMGMVVCYIVGSVVAHVGQRAVKESIEQYKKAHPIQSNEADAGNTGSDEESATVGRIDQSSDTDTSRSAA